MNKTEIEELKDLFSSILCLAVEGPEVMKCIVVTDKIAKEANLGCNLCNKHLDIYSDGERQCKSCGDLLSYTDWICTNCGESTLAGDGESEVKT